MYKYVCFEKLAAYISRGVGREIMAEILRLLAWQVASMEN